MKPVVIEGYTHVLGAPPNWDQDSNGRCAALHVRAEVINQVPFLRSAWETEPTEAAMLLAGARLVLGVAVPVHPVVHLEVTEVPDDIAPTLVATQFVDLRGQPAVHVEMVFGREKRAFSDVVLNTATLPQAIQVGADSIMALAREQEWI